MSAIGNITFSEIEWDKVPTRELSLCLGLGPEHKASEVYKNVQFKLTETAHFINKRLKGDEEDENLLDLKEKMRLDSSFHIEEIQEKIKPLEEERQKQREMIIESIRICVILYKHSQGPLKAVEPFLKYLTFRFPEEKMATKEFIEEALKKGDDEAIYAFSLIQPDKELRAHILQYILTEEHSELGQSSLLKIKEKLKNRPSGSRFF